MKNRWFSYVIFIMLLLLFIGSIGSGFIYIMTLILKFEFIKRFGLFLFLVDFFLGILLLIPISILFEAIIRYMLVKNKIIILISESIQFLLLCWYLHSTNAFFRIIEYSSFGNEILVYFVMYLFLISLKFIGGKIKEEDAKSSS
jgi:hypothetical protein